MKFLVSLCSSYLITLLSVHVVQVVISMVLVPALSDAEADPAILAQPQLPAFIDPASGRFSFSFNTQHPQGEPMEAEADRSSIYSPYTTYNPLQFGGYPAFGRGIFAGGNGWGYPAYPQYNPWTVPGGYPGARGAFYPGHVGGYQPALPGYYPGYPFYPAGVLPQQTQERKSKSQE